MSVEKCIFCQIASGKIPANKVYEDEDILAFEDVDPKAPVHILVIPKKHIASLLELESEDQKLAADFLFRIQEIAKQLNLAETGFRVVNNIGKQGGQTVFHIHFHVLGGRDLGWPPG